MKVDCFLVLAGGFCRLHGGEAGLCSVAFLPFRRSMETLCSCWKARWWWNIWGWSWGLHSNSATTSTNSNRAGCDSWPCFFFLRELHKTGSIFLWGYKTSVMFFYISGASQARKEVNSRLFVIYGGLAIHQRSPKYQNSPGCSVTQLWFSTDEAV